MCKQGSIFIYKTKKLQNSSLVKKIKENQTETKLQNSSLVKKIKEKQTQLSILDIDIYRIKLKFFFELVSCFNLLQVHVLVAQTRIFPWITNLLKQFTIQILKKIENQFYLCIILRLVLKLGYDAPLFFGLMLRFQEFLENRSSEP